MFKLLSKAIVRIDTDVGSGFMSSYVLDINSMTSSGIDKIIVTGSGFCKDPVRSFLAAQGEAIERSVFLHGHHFIDFVISDDIYLPEEPKLLNPDLLGFRGATLSYPAKVNGNPGSNIPRNCVHWDRRSELGVAPLRMSTGWAYHTTCEEAVFKAASETIERDIALRFWCLGDIRGDYLSSHSICSMGKDYVTRARKSLRWYGFIAKVKHRLCKSGVQFFVLLAAISDTPPYLTVGTGISDTKELAFDKAISELIHLRHYQWERVVSGTRTNDSETLDFGIDEAIHNVQLKEKALLRFETFSSNNKDYNYIKKEFAEIGFSTEPLGVRGAVSRVWIDGCQPLSPPGFDCGVANQWILDNPDACDLWSDNRVHPFP